MRWLGVAEPATRADLERALRDRRELVAFVDEDGREHSVARGVAPNGRMIVFDQVRGRAPMCLAIVSTAVTGTSERDESRPDEQAEAVAREYAERRPGLEGLERMVSRAVTLEDLGLANGDGTKPRGGETDDADGRPERGGSAAAAHG